MPLTLEIEFLGGVCFAATAPDTESPDWPPQPDRVFSALTATWDAHGEPDDERQALEWLESLPPPLCVASDTLDRSAPVVFVPPNDPRTDRAKNAKGVLPAMRNRQPRRFPAARPLEPLVRHIWHAEPDEPTLAALNRLARNTAYVGHSSSLTRCRFLQGDVPPAESLTAARRRIYPGRLAELSNAYARFRKSADRKDRPSPGALHTPLAPRPQPAQGVFSARWLILEHVLGEMPDIRAAAIVARGIRRALMSAYGSVGAPIPSTLSGHESDGSPSRAPHLAIVPLAFVGFPYADGRVLGFALVPSAHDELFADATFLGALRRLAPLDERLGRRVIEVKSPEGTQPDRAFAIKLSPSFEAVAGRRSLDPALYMRRARTFATVTPIVLDRFLKKQGEARQEEIAEQIAAACRHIGLPSPQMVVCDKHAATQGAPSAYPSRNAPAWLKWRLPESLVGRQLTHAVIRFDAPVEGPVMLGAGRFVGLGLCLPIDSPSGEDR